MNKIQPIILHNARECLPFGTRYKLKVKRNPGLGLTANSTTIVADTVIIEKAIHRAYAQSGLAPTAIKDFESESGPSSGSLGDMTKENNDAETKSVVAFDYQLEKKIYSGGSDGYDAHRGVKEFLATPRIVQYGTLANTDSATTFSPFDVSIHLMNLAANYEKIKGFHSVRFDTVVTIEFNANRFQTGYYLLGFVPHAGTAYNHYTIARRYDKTVITQLPHVKFDLNCDTQAQLTIPYVSGTNAMKVTDLGVANFAGSPGEVFLYPYIPLGSTAGSTTASYTIWIHYINVEFFGAAIPQSGFRGGKKGKDLLTKEMKKQGPVEAIMTLITDTSTALTGVPLLSSIAGPVSWLSEAMRKTAMSFGWSKPISIDPGIRVVREIAPYLANYDAKSIANSMALSSSNHVEMAPGFGGTDLDELSIDYLKSIKSYYQTITWTDGLPAGTALMNGYSHPAVYVIDTVDGGATIRSFTPIAFLANLFDQWRGGIRFHFKIVKTEFHSGRLMFAWTGHTNQYGLAVPSMSLTEANYVHKEIIDIREGSEFTIEVPFCSITNWNNTESTDRNISGRWYLYVLDPLKEPATVSGTIQIVMEVSGAPDLQFAVPKPFLYAPIIPTTYQSGFNNCTLIDSVVGEATGKELDLRYASLCVGEATLSLRPLLKRGGFPEIGFTVAASSSTVLPFAIGWLTSQAVGLPLGIATVDPYSIIGSCYALSRGGMRITAIPTLGAAVGTDFFFLKRMKGSDSFSAFRTTPGITFAQCVYDYQGAAMHVYPQTLGGTTIQVPQYTLGHSRGTEVNLYTSTVPFTVVDPLADRSVITQRVLAGTATASIFYRAVADDFNLGCFVSIPPMYLVVRP